MNDPDLVRVLAKHAQEFHPVIGFNAATDRILSLDLSGNNPAFDAGVYNDMEKFSQFIEERRNGERPAFLMGGYREIREMYRRSVLFDQNLKDNISAKAEPRCLHLGVDIWGPAGTKVFAPLGGMVHSFSNNDNFGDYGPTIILQHQLDTVNFYTLYGHLSLENIKGLRKGQFITRGENFARFGTTEENGSWPAHLHFQIIHQIDYYEGDYPGVCRISEAAHYIKNCPDPDLLLGLKAKMQHTL